MSIRLELIRESITWAEKLDEYGARVTVRLDDKAQQTGVIAGAFLAGAFGFLKPETLSLLGKIATAAADGILLAVVLLLVICVGACLSVTWLRYTPIPVGLSVIEDMNDDVLRLSNDEIDEELIENLYRERLRVWDKILKDRQDLNNIKAKRLRFAQWFLAVNIFLISGLLMTVIGSSIVAKF